MCLGQYVCPADGKAAALVMPKANSESMQHHLDLIAAAVTPGKHAVLVVDRAAWHVTEKLLVPANLSILPLPPYSPELNPVEQIWQQLRNRIGQIGASRTMTKLLMCVAKHGIRSPTNPTPSEIFALESGL